MRQVVLDTETTGLEPEQGHRIIEIGGVELLDRRLTGKTFHQYINPQRQIDQGALQVHGITEEFLAAKPVFADIAEDFIGFIEDAELVIHNAPFDASFLDHELARLPGEKRRIEDLCQVIDSLALARDRYPGQKNSLDALCRRHEVDNSARENHGALLDAELLVEIYLAMTGGQTAMFAAPGEQQFSAAADTFTPLAAGRPKLKVISATPEELSRHQEFMAQLAAPA